MHKLFVLYDGTCQFCVRCRRWLEAQPKFLDMVFIPAASAAAKRCFPDLRDVDKVEELTVVADDGAVYRGERAWIMCLYALCEYREWSTTLATASMLPLAKRAFNFLSQNRQWISRWFGISEEEALAEIRREPPAEVWVDDIKILPEVPHGR